ncbi:MAG: MarR family transcriptional regulator [Sphingopyxis sp.]
MEIKDQMMTSKIDNPFAMPPIVPHTAHHSAAHIPPAPATGAPLLPGDAPGDLHTWGRPRLLCFAQPALAAPLVDRSAAALDMVMDMRPLADFASVAISAAHMLWITLDAAPSPALLATIRARMDEEALAAIIQTNTDSIDAVWAELSDTPGVTLLIDPGEGDCLAALAQAMRRTTQGIHAPMAEVRDQQLERLHEEVQRISRLLARLSMDDSNRMAQSPDGSRLPASPFIDDNVRSPMRSFAAAPVDHAARPPVSAQAVRQIIRQRRARDEFFGPDIFADPAWDMLLDLYAARLEHMPVSVSSLCIAAAVPATTALRWIKTLTDSAFFERQADQLDGRRIFVALSQRALDGMHRYFTRVAADPVLI